MTAQVFVTLIMDTAVSAAVDMDWSTVIQQAHAGVHQL